MTYLVLDRTLLLVGTYKKIQGKKVTKLTSAIADLGCLLFHLYSCFLHVNASLMQLVTFNLQNAVKCMQYWVMQRVKQCSIR